MRPCRAPIYTVCVRIYTWTYKQGRPWDWRRRWFLASHLPENVAAAGWGEPADGAAVAAAAAVAGAVIRMLAAAGCYRTDVAAVHNSAAVVAKSWGVHRLQHNPG